MPFYSLCTGDATDYLAANGCDMGPVLHIECIRIVYDDKPPGDDDPEFKSRGCINGSCFQYEKDDDLFLQKAPDIVSCTDEAKSTLVMIDPDAPNRVPDTLPPGKGIKDGESGPYLHWLVTNMGVSAKTGKQTVRYEGPAPPEGKHRYIFIEFEQTGDVIVNSTEREKWNFKGFLKDNAAVLKPKACNFYYCSADRKAAGGEPATPWRNGTACDKFWYPFRPTARPPTESEAAKEKEAMEKALLK